MTTLTTARSWHRPLMASAVLLFLLAAASFVGMLTDDRTLLNESIWLKPMKFGISFGVYAATLAWLIGKLQKAKRFGWWLGTIFALGALADVGVIAYAAAQGTFSHFNAETDPVARLVQTIFNVAVPPILLTTLALAIMLLMQRPGDRALTRALRAGLGLAVLGMIAAVWLSNGSGPDPRKVTDANGKEVTMLGAHGIGDPDGHGMPLTNWSATGGDLRVPHFVGLHGIHVLLILVAVLGVLGARNRWLSDERVRSRLVGAVALGYTGVFVVVAWQAKRGQSVIHPDKQTLLAFAAVAGLTLLVAVTAVLGSLRRAARARTAS